MSVTDLDKVDMMGFTKEGTCFNMVISDDLDWEEELVHLWILQDKINAYLALLQDAEWRAKKVQDAQYVEILVFFLYDLTEKAEKFLQTAQDQLGQHGVKITAIVKPEAFKTKAPKKNRKDKKMGS